MSKLRTETICSSCQHPQCLRCGKLIIMNLCHLLVVGPWAVNRNLWGSSPIKWGLTMILAHILEFFLEPNKIVRVFDFYYIVVIIIAIIIPVMNIQPLSKKSDWPSPLKCIEFEPERWSLTHESDSNGWYVFIGKCYLANKSLVCSNSDTDKQRGWFRNNCRVAMVTENPLVNTYCSIYSLGDVSPYFYK